jgi:ATP-dependent Clp protease adaptor protein ClpS
VANQQNSTGVIERTKKEEKFKKPKMYKVIFLNDDYTPMEFVVFLLMNIFRKGETEAKSLTNEIHTKGSAIAGVYTHEIAETKVAHAFKHIHDHQHPLMLQMEPE